jgi:methylmalonyl-CoA/ethylmalonyl-CoA epimerase
MPSKNTPKLRLHHCGINVVDFEGSIKWYGDMLGFTVAKRLRLPGRPGEIAFLKHGDFYLEFFELTDAAGAPPNQDKEMRNPGLRHFAFAVEDVKGTVAWLRERGVEILFENIIEGKPMAYIRDNSGNRVELVSLDAP